MELFNKVSFPKRIICLTEETTETLYLLGQGDKVVGISGYTVRPTEARKKPKVCAYITAKFDKIYELKPDLIFAFSDLQADIVKELVKQGLNVVTFNQRSVNEILSMILMVGSLVGCQERAQKLVEDFQSELNRIADIGKTLSRRPKVFFEEWKDPLISGIRWVSELIEIAGGEDIFPELRSCQSGSERVVSADEVIKRNPDIIIASWCGRKVDKKAICSRPNWSEINAVKNNQIYEIKSTYILQPGPASLTDGVRQLQEIILQAVIK